jgi:hypothetical protein
MDAVRGTHIVLILSFSSIDTQTHTHIHASILTHSEYMIC